MNSSASPPELSVPPPTEPSSDGDAAEPIRLEGFAPAQDAQDLYQKREKIFTRFVGGKFQRLRFFTGWPLLVGYFATPWLTWDGRQAILFDLPARQFHLFGLTIWPQDLWLLGWLLMIAAFALFAVTTVVGRLWCGYTCPQTVWTAVFMWVEQLTEGQRHQRIKLDQAPWNADKLARRTAKHSLWLGWALLTGLAFVGYFTPIRALALDLVTLDFTAISGWALFWVGFFTLATYVNAGWLREQVCIYMCPYARFQSAMIDGDTLIVSYDPARGEPRGSRKRQTKPAELGDCIDCQLCVQVCPTGIDIRDGLQYQCIGCAHCIDACDQVMAKMDYAPGLISYTTQRHLQGGAIRWLRGRSIGYATICVVIIGAFAAALFQRSTFAFDILRERGALYQVTSAGLVANNYQLKVMNKSQTRERYTIAVTTPEWLEINGTTELAVEPGAIVDEALQLVASAQTATTTTMTLRVCSPRNCVDEQSSFIAPVTGPRKGEVTQ